MAGPWEKYGAQPSAPAAGPWDKYAPKVDQQSAVPSGQSKRPDKISVAEDVARSALTGLGEGVTGTVGLTGDVRSMGDSLGTWLGDLLGLPRLTPEQQAQMDRPFGLPNIKPPTTGDIEEAIGFDKSVKHEPQTTAGKYARTAGQFVPIAATGGGRAAIQYGVVPGLVSEAAGQATEGTKWETPARIAGGVAGGGAGALLRKVVTPRVVPAANRAAADVLRREGIRGLTEGQITRAPKTLVKERQALGNRDYTRRLSQSEQLTKAALRRVGENAERATPEVIDGAFTRIGEQFDDLSARNNATLDRKFASDLRDTVQTYARRVEQPNRVPAIADYLEEIQNASRNGAIAGDAYQSLRSRIQADARAIKDPYAKRALFEMADDLDDLMERSIGKSNPADLGGFRLAREQYKNMLVIEDASTVAGSDAALGLLSPAALRSATKRVYGKRNMARGKGSFEELTRAAAALLSELPQTGFAPAINPNSLANMNIPSMVALGIPRLLRELRMTGPGTRYMTNQIMAPRPGATNLPVSGIIAPVAPNISAQTRK